MQQQQTAFENVVGKGEIACYEQCLLFPLQLGYITVSPFVHIFDIISLFAVELEEPKSGISCKELSHFGTLTLKYQQRPKFIREFGISLHLFNPFPNDKF